MSLYVHLSGVVITCAVCDCIALVLRKQYILTGAAVGGSVVGLPSLPNKNKQKEEKRY